MQGKEQNYISIFNYNRHEKLANWLTLENIAVTAQIRFMEL